MSTQRSRSKIATMAGLVLTAVLTLSACSSDDAASQDAAQSAAAPDVDIAFTVDGDTEEVSIDGELALDEPAAWVIAEGDGEAVTDEDLLYIHAATVDIDNEEILSHDFDHGGSTLPMSDLSANNPALYEALSGAAIGSDLAFYMPADAVGMDTPDYLTLFTVEGVVPGHATGTPVDASDLNEALPAVTLDEDTQGPTIAKPEGETPDELVVDVLKQGDGREVQPESSVTIHYRGVKWSDGEEFDASWGPDNTGTPITFELQQLIVGWQEGLAGQKVGSQVVMSIPSELAYGASQGHDLQDETLVFVIDILHSADPMPNE